MALALENGRRQFDYWLTVYKRTWKGTLISSFLLPLLYLAAMGIGLGSFVDSNGTGALGGVSYLQYIAPGLLAATALQVAVGESTYPVMSGLKWQKFYYSMIATPLRPADVVYGQLGFIAFRVGSTCAVFLVVIAAFGGSAVAARACWLCRSRCWSGWPSPDRSRRTPPRWRTTRASR